MEPDAVVAEVLRRRQVCPQQVFTWGREMRVGAATRLDFVPIVPATSLPLPGPVAARARSSPSIEVELAGAALRVVPRIGVNPARHWERGEPAAPGCVSTQ
jgi:transposase